MRRAFLVVAACATVSLAVTVSAQAATTAPSGAGSPSAANTAKSKAKVYEFCGSFVGCNPTPFLIYPKTKTWEFEGYAETVFSGSYTKVKKVITFHYSFEYPCELIMVKSGKNYVGHSEGGCGTEEVVLTLK
jgi:hypothetical protein